MPALAGVIVGAMFGWGYGIALLTCAVLIMLFFRDPRREADVSERAVLAPADGRVVGVEKLAGGHRLAPEAVQRISIFMSPLDVHVNRAPCDGVVEAVAYNPGKFSAAYKGEASDLNESNALLIRTRAGYRMVVVQIAGWMARRIVCDVGVGDGISRGSRFGLIMFGSRVDLYLPEGVSVKSEPGARVQAGRTVIAEAT